MFMAFVQPHVPVVFSRVGKRKTPYVSVLLVLILSYLPMLGGVETIALLTDVGIFIVYIFVNSSLIWLRFSKPKAKRTFRSPISIGKMPLLAVLGIASSGLMLLHFDAVLLLYESVVIAIGLIFYKLFSNAKKLEKIEEKYIRLFRKSLYTSKHRDMHSASRTRK
jgi:APA family basic amino acid/polyamine antiporter